ncbi:MAG: FeoB-associated Cys-rich membrane protein [Lachnospira sp.]
MKAVGTIVVGLILAVIVGAAVYSMVRGRIKGKHSCDGSCGHCRGCH